MVRSPEHLPESFLSLQSSFYIRHVQSKPFTPQGLRNRENTRESGRKKGPPGELLCTRWSEPPPLERLQRFRIGESIPVVAHKRAVPFSSNENRDGPPRIHSPIFSGRFLRLLWGEGPVDQRREERQERGGCRACQDVAVDKPSAALRPPPRDGESSSRDSIPKLNSPIRPGV